MANQSENDRKDVGEFFEDIPVLLSQRKAVFHMVQHYWNKVLGRPFVSTPEFTVANLACGWAIDSIPLSLALEGKSRYDLMMAISQKPTPQNVIVQNYEKDPDPIKAATLDPLIHLLTADPKSYHEADICALPIDAETIDLCFMRNPNWEYDFTKEQVVQAYREIDRVLKPGGVYWSTHVRQVEFETSKRMLTELLKGKFKIRVEGENMYPHTRLSFTDPLTGVSGKVSLDSFILIAEKLAK